MARKSSGNARPEPIVVYAPLGQLKIYEITEAELNQLASGSDSQQLNFALALLPVSITLLITLQTVEISSDRTFQVYVIGFFVSFVQGLICLFRWRKECRMHERIVNGIRDRIPPASDKSEQITSIDDTNTA